MSSVITLKIVNLKWKADVAKFPAKCHESWLGMLDTMQEENYVP